MPRLLFLLDRTAVLFIGIAVGAVIGLSFAGGGGEATAPQPVEIVEPETQPGAAPAEQALSADLDRLLATRVAQGGTVHIGVYGDSFADGLWAALYRDFRGDEDVVVHQFSRNSTGFTRYRQLDLAEDIAARLAEQPVDIAVISFGANDTQGIYTGGNSAAAYMSEEWQEIVAERATEIVTMLRENGAIVYWVGLPRMRDGEFDAQIGQMNAFYAALTDRLGVPFIDTRALTVDEQGRYAAYLPHPETGERTLVRANDGIHMTGIGYSVLIGDLAGRIRGSLELARQEAVGEEAPVSAEAAAGNGSG